MARPSIENKSLLIGDSSYKLYSGMPKPEFMLIGAAKSGTTSFSSYLPIHPQVAQCRIKEPNFWSWKLCTKEQYQSLFVNKNPLRSPAKNERISGEYSTSYLLNPLVPRRVAARLPNTKIIILLRNPIERAYSHFIMSQREGMEPYRSFDEIVRREIEEVPALLEAHQRGFLTPGNQINAHRTMPDGTPINVAEHNTDWTLHPLTTDKELFRFYGSSYVFRSIYHDQLWRWLQLFPRQQIKIIQSEYFMSNRREVMDEVCQFLGLEPYGFSEKELAHSWGGGASNDEKPGDYVAMEDKTRSLLSDFFAPHNEKLFELIGSSYDWN